MQELEELLLRQPYVAGFSPTAADREAATELEQAAPEEAAHPNVRRWLRNVNSFSPAERAAWT
jgi:glutathione S-transferase